VRALVVAEATPNRAGDGQVAELAAALESWPVPFASRDAALRFFGGPSPRARAWVSGLEERAGRWWPRFELDVMVRALREATDRSYWQEWDQIRCPTLVVRAERGDVAPADARSMVSRLPDARLAELSGAGHDLHLDRPDDWRAAVGGFLDGLPR
jgi:pimeloyl-ACP methyl ester carboxylesterase